MKRQDEKCQGGVSQPKERGEKDRYERVEGLGRIDHKFSGDRPLVDVELVFEVEEQTRRLAS